MRRRKTQCLRKVPGRNIFEWTAGLFKSTCNLLIIYGLTLVVSSASLTLVDQAHWFDDFYLSFKEAIVVALPASFAAAIVDNLS